MGYQVSASTKEDQNGAQQSPPSLSLVLVWGRWTKFLFTDFGTPYAWISPYLIAPDGRGSSSRTSFEGKIGTRGAQFLDLPRPQNQGTETLICTLLPTLGRSARTALLSFASWELCEHLTLQRGKAERMTMIGMAPGQSSPIITIQRPGWCDHAPISSGLMVGANEPKSTHRQTTCH